jgi:AraC-like DNA-binding protein
MELELTERGTGRILVSPLSHTQQPLSKLVPSVSMHAQGEAWKATFEYFQGNGFFANYSQLHIGRPVVLCASGNVAAIELRFMLGDPLRGKWEGIKDPVLLRDQFALSYTPYISTEAHLHQGNYATFDIHFELPYLERLAVDFPLLEVFLNDVHRAVAGDLTPLHHYCTPSMRAAIQFLLNHPFSVKSQPYLLEAKVTELLVSALEIVHEDRAPSKFVLSATDIDALHEVKKRIEADASVPLSYKELQRCGLNENKLLNGFKQVFGTTPYQYHLELKMKMAEGLLLTTNESVSHIAWTVGYHHVSNFSLEFSKRFGCSPLEFRRRSRKRP